ncbi:MAG: orotidine-5'-phosphate decarboxylase [Spirochaetia bacterium]|nr:orotidine-5'-phosphate decarboxylase [Spirochaetia bacterium]
MVLKSNFADRLICEIDKKQNPSVVGLDSNFAKIPQFIKDDFEGSYEDKLKSASMAVYEFNKKIIDSIYDIVPCVKLQIAYYEELGGYGLEAYKKTSDYAKSRGMLVIADAKRNDIGTTCKAYSNAFLGETEIFGMKKKIFDVDCLTVNGYLGFEGVEPFINDCQTFSKGIFILVKTSNKGSEEFQCVDTVTPYGKNYMLMGNLVKKWGEPLTGSSGYSSVGAVVGATFPEEAHNLRAAMPTSIFLVPGYGAQGGTADDTLPCFNKDGLGAIVNSSRKIIFAFQGKNDDRNFQTYVRQAALDMKNDLISALKKGKICRWK